MRYAVLPLIFALALSASAQTPQPTPMPGTYVHDFAGVITPEKRAEIQAKAERLKAEYKTEIAVVTIESLGGEDSFDYSMRMARAWGIGSADEGSRGLLILVAVKDRKTAFRTSRHTEGELPDAVTGKISRDMGADFKRGDFGAGLSAGMDMVLERVGAEYEAPRPAAVSSDGGGLGLWWLLLVGIPAGGATLFGVRAARRSGRRRMEEERKRRRRESRSMVGTTRARPTPSKPSSKRNAKTPKRGEPKRKSYGETWPETGPSTYSLPTASSSSSSWDSDSSSSSSSYDSGSSYGGSSDFGGGGSDSSW